MISKNKGGLFSCLNLKMFKKSTKVVFFVEIHGASTPISIHWPFTVQNYGIMHGARENNGTNYFCQYGIIICAHRVNIS